MLTGAERTIICTMKALVKTKADKGLELLDVPMPEVSNKPPRKGAMHVSALLRGFCHFSHTQMLILAQLSRAISNPGMRKRLAKQMMKTVPMLLMNAFSA